MTRILAIDPGNTDSAYTVIDQATRRPVRFAKMPNDDLLDMLHCRAFDDCHHTAIEMVASYGMPVGADVFETCVWIGRFFQIATLHHPGQIETVKRNPVKLHHCHSSKAKDSNITQALVDRFASGVRNHGKGTKAEPGWFYGFKADVWQAYALAVYVADTTHATTHTTQATTHATTGPLEDALDDDTWTCPACRRLECEQPTLLSAAHGWVHVEDAKIAGGVL